MTIRNLSKLFIPLLCLLLITGCVGKREINDLALVMAMGIDLTKDNKLQVTIQVARPADARGQTGAPSGNTGDPLWSTSATGNTLFETIRNLATVSSRRIFWAHNFIIVINEDVAKRGISEIIDFFTRNPELRMRTWMVTTPDKAREVVSQVTGLEVIPGQSMDKLFRYSDITSAAPRTELLDIQSAYLSESSQPYMARLRLVNSGVSNKKPGHHGSYKQVQLAGTSVFRDDKLVGTLSKDETTGFLPFVEKIKSEIIVLPCPNNSSEHVSLEVKKFNFKVSPFFKNSKPSFRVYTSLNTNLVDASCPISLNDQRAINQLETNLDNKLKKQIETVVHKAQDEYKSDFLELGKLFDNKYPEEWRKLSSNWSTIFPTVPITVKVNGKIKSTVLLYEPTRSGKK